MKRRDFLDGFKSAGVATAAAAATSVVNIDALAASELSGIESVTDMNGLKERVGRPDELVFLMGYRGPIDGGEGFFVWDSASSSPHNGGTVIAPKPARPGRWMRATGGGPINVKWFGARGDGTTNDRAAVRRAFLEAQVSSRLLYIPAGTYLLEAAVSLDMRGGQTGIFGDGIGLSIIKNRSLKIYNGKKASIRDLSFNNCSMRLESISNFNISYIELFSLKKTAIGITACSNGVIHSCILRDVDNSGIRMNKNGDGKENACRNITVCECYFENVTRVGRDGHGAVGVTSDGGKAEHDTITISNNIINGVVKGVGIIGDGIIRNYTVIGNQLRGNGSEKSLEAITFGEAYDVLVAQNRIIGNGGWISGILLYCGVGVSRAIIRDNYIEDVDNGIFAHYPNGSDSSSEDCEISGNFIRNVEQGFLAYKSGKGDPNVIRCWLGIGNLIQNASENSYNRNGLGWIYKTTIGGSSLWVDSGRRLRIEGGTSGPSDPDADGTVIGSQF